MSRFRVLVLVGVIATVVTLLVGQKAGEVPDCATGSVLELEVARTEEKATELIGSCDEAGLDVLRDGLRADNLAFVPLYIASVALWSVLAAKDLRWSSERRQQLVLAAAVVIAVAGAFDLVENHYLGKVVDAAGASSDIGLATAASVVKWLLVLYAVPVSVIGMVRCVKAAVRPA